MARAPNGWQGRFVASSDKTICVIQARVGSTRLPGKVLADLGGQPMLAFQLQRLAGGIDIPLVVATSTLDRDDAIEDVALSAGASVVRGDEQDVLGRFLEVLDRMPADTVIRLTADCPLSDPEIVAAVVDKHHRVGADYTSNTLPRTYPKGLDVEVMSANCLRMAAREACESFEREHVTPFLYRHPERFRLANLRTPELAGDERWTVDTPEDLERVREIVAAMEPSKSFTWQDAFMSVGRTRAGFSGQLHLRPSEPDDRDRLLEWRNDADSVRYSESSRMITAQEHQAWYDMVLEDPGTRLWIGELDGVPIGMVRIDVRAAQGRVSIAIDQRQRGRGLGRELLTRVQETLANDFQIDALDARVSHRNKPSKRLFVGCHFAEIASDGDFAVLHWVNRPADRRVQ